MIDGMHTYTAAEIETNLKNAGFPSVQVTREPKKNWLKVVGIK